jgi:hypothetical protein
MSPEQRAAFLDAWETASGWGGAAQECRDELDDLTRAGFTITHSSVRDHTDCDVCDATTEIEEWEKEKLTGEWLPVTRPCPAGRLVPWEPEGEQK